MKPGEAVFTLDTVCWSVFFAHAAGPFDIFCAVSRSRIGLCVAGEQKKDAEPVLVFEVGRGEFG